MAFFKLELIQVPFMLIGRSIFHEKVLLSLLSIWMGREALRKDKRISFVYVPLYPFTFSLLCELAVIWVLGRWGWILTKIFNRIKIYFRPQKIEFWLCLRIHSFFRGRRVKTLCLLACIYLPSLFFSLCLPASTSRALVFPGLKDKTMGWSLQQYHLFVFFKQPATQPEDNGHLIYSSSGWSYLIPRHSCPPYISIANQSGFVMAFYWTWFN